MKDINGTVIGKNIYEAIKMMDSRTDQAEAALSILEYAFEDLDNSTGTIKMVVHMAKPYIDSSQKRYKANCENGKKGGAPSGNQHARKQPNNNPITTQNQPNNNPKSTQNQPKINLNTNTNITIKENSNTNINMDDKSEKLFNRVWKHYPRKENMERAKVAWCEINPDVDLARTMANKIDEFAKTDLWNCDNGKYVPMFYNWLADKRWQDEVFKPTTIEFNF